MGIELEVKFRATEELLEKIRSRAPGQEQIYRMQTTYYDTPSGAYAAKKCTLRRRLENEINALYDRLAQALKTENERLRLENAQLKAENEKLRLV